MAPGSHRNQLTINCREYCKYLKSQLREFPKFSFTFLIIATCETTPGTAKERDVLEPRDSSVPGSVLTVGATKTIKYPTAYWKLLAHCLFCPVWSLVSLFLSSQSSLSTPAQLRLIHIEVLKQHLLCSWILHLLSQALFLKTGLLSLSLFWITWLVSLSAPRTGASLGFASLVTKDQNRIYISPVQIDSWLGDLNV